MIGSRKLGISDEAERSAQRMMEKIRDGKIKQHLMRNTYQVRQETLEEREFAEYSDFIKTKLSFEILKLNGSDMHE